MNAGKTSTPEAAGSVMLRSIGLFMIAQLVLVFGLMVVMQRFVWPGDEAARAVQASAWLAVVVQLFTFAIARLVARQQVIAAWGLGVLMRFAAVAFWAFLGIKALGLLASPALLSLVVFFFVSTLVEPLFLD